MSESSIHSAKIVASAVASHFENHFAAIAGKESDAFLQQPDIKTIEAIINAGFWSSLRREEGRSPKISLAFLPPGECENPLLFGRKLPLSPKILTKIAPGVERSGIHLGVWRDSEELYLWGTTKSVPPFCFILEVVEPGLLVVKHRRTQGFGKFVNVAILDGDQVKIVLDETSTIPDCPDLLTNMMGLNSTSSWNTSINVLVQMAASMRAHGRGGALLVVPKDTDEWKRSIVQPITYPVAPSFNGLAQLLQQSKQEKQDVSWQTALNREVDYITGLSAVDGATIITQDCELLAFGAKIHRASGSEQVEKIILTEPVVGNKALVVHPSLTGGTRHLSAAQFVHDQKGSLALVASQDGRFTIFAWSPCEGMVHAHRVDSLLL
ncbi:putative sensor domain DACNV-containing protein [Desertivirga arenae]|uniref:putative sensor domain DACNV-containing protein n=1 Tax=Desertivirga arenae TaxID=2810309 RepID=UPI001A9676F6|nr:hypothetical protein [Pedobacter sp. SYSU D00823]